MSDFVRMVVVPSVVIGAIMFFLLTLASYLAPPAPTCGSAEVALQTPSGWICVSGRKP